MLRTPVALVATVAVLLGVMYAVMVPAGLPYDEPSHWANVVFLVDHGRLFDLRSAGVSYEAQQGPLAYLAYAAPAGFARLLGLSGSTAFTISRLVGLVGLVALVLVMNKLLRRVVPHHPATALVATAVVCLNPMVVAMAASIQNDVLSLVLAVAAMAVATDPRQLDRRRAVLLGVLSGAAVLAKITVAPALLVVAVVLLARRTPLPRLLSALFAAVAISGWWFVRNLLLYSDLTGVAGVRALGFSFPPAPVRGLGGVKDLVSEMVTYLWVPTEYFRNAIHLPPPVRVLVAVVTFGFAVFGLRLVAGAVARGWPSGAAWTVVGTAVLALVVWFVTRVAIQGVSVRTAYVALPAWGLLAGGALMAPGRFAGARPAIAAAFVGALHIVVLSLTITTRLGQPLLVP